MALGDRQSSDLTDGAWISLAAARAILTIHISSRGQYLNDGARIRDPASAVVREELGRHGSFSFSAHAHAPSSSASASASALAVVREELDQHGSFSSSAHAPSLSALVVVGGERGIGA